MQEEARSRPEYNGSATQAPGSATQDILWLGPARDAARHSGSSAADGAGSARAPACSSVNVGPQASPPDGTWVEIIDDSVIDLSGDTLAWADAPELPEQPQGALALDLSAACSPHKPSALSAGSPLPPGLQRARSRGPAPAAAWLGQVIATVRSLAVLVVCLLFATAWFLHGAVSQFASSVHPTPPSDANWPTGAQSSAFAPPSPPQAPGGPAVAWRLEPSSCSLKDFVGLMDCRHGCGAPPRPAGGAPRPNRLTPLGPAARRPLPRQV